MGWRPTWVVLAFVLSAAGAAPAFADEAPLSFPDGTSFTADINDGPAVTTLHNDTATPRKIRLALDVTDGTGSGVTLQPVGEIEIPAAGTERLAVTIRELGSPVAGFIVVIDHASGAVFRQAFKLTADQEPAVTTWASTGYLLPHETTAELSPLPLKSTACKSTTANLVSQDDVVTLNATCHGSSLRLKVSDLEKGRTGEYKGTLKVGATDVAVAFTRRAPRFLAIAVLLLGAALALALRGYLSRDQIRKARRDIKSLRGWALGPPPGWGSCTQAAQWLVRAPSQTAEPLERALSQQALWGRRRHGVYWFFAPSRASMKTVADASNTLDQAKATNEDWEHSYGSAFADLAISDPPQLARRAQLLATGTDAATHEPAEEGETGPPRVGIAGVQALLKEVRAIKVVASLWTENSELQKGIGPRPPTAHETELSAKLCERWAAAQLESCAIEALLKRTVDAVAVLADGVGARLSALAKDVDALSAGVPPSDETTGSLGRRGGFGTNLEGVPPPRRQLLAVVLPGLPELISTAQRLLVVGGRILGETLVVLLALAVVLAGGLAAVYNDKAWGTWEDIWTTFLAAAAGTVVLTPLIAAIDRLGGTKAAERDGG